MLGHLTRSELFEGTPEEVPQPAAALNCQLLSRLQQRKRKVNHLCMTETSKKPPSPKPEVNFCDSNKASCGSLREVRRYD